MKNKWKHTWQRLAVAALCLLLPAAMAGVSLAAYTRANFSRAVVQNRNGTLLRFSSNYLYEYAGSSEAQYPDHALPFPAAPEASLDEEITLTLRLHNFLQNGAEGDSSLVSQVDIPYTLTLRFADGRADGVYPVTFRDEAGAGETNEVQGAGTYTHTATLPGGDKHTHTYELGILRRDLDKLRIVAKAVPEASAGGSGQLLAAVLLPCTSAEKVLGFSCTGSFPDAAAGHAPSEYAGLNYAVTASGGAGTARLSWDSTRVKIDPFFLQKLGKTDTDIVIEGTIHSITFPMDQNNETGSYLIPFYWVAGREEIKTWQDAAALIGVSAAEDTAAKGAESGA